THARQAATVQFSAQRGGTPRRSLLRNCWAERGPLGRLTGEAAGGFRFVVPIDLHFPTTYLLSSPAIGADQLGQRRPGIVIVMGKNFAADERDLQKTELVGEKPFDRCFVGGIENCPASSATLGHFIT